MGSKESKSGLGAKVAGWYIKRKLKTMNKKQWLGIIRTGLAAAGGVAVGKGWLDDAALEAVIGGLLTIITAVWSVKTPEKKEG